MRMQQEILRLWNAERTTVVLVTLDIEEAVYRADRIVVMSPQPGTTRNILPIRLSRPRDRADQEFVRVLKLIHDELFESDSMAEFAQRISSRRRYLEGNHGRGPSVDDLRAVPRIASASPERYSG
jgi:ABC-type proline/glycine betaine transport system ATPase subunit